MMNLKQGSKKLETYIEEGIRLKCEVATEFRPLLAEQWVSGLHNKETISSVRAIMHQWKKEGRCNIDNVVKLVRYTEGEGIASNNPHPLSTEEKMTKALDNLTQAIASNSIGGSQAPRSRTPATGQVGRPPGQRMLPSPGDDSVCCWRCGQMGHRSPECANSPLPFAERTKIKQADLLRMSQNSQSKARDPPLSHTLGKAPESQKPLGAITAQVDATLTDPTDTVHQNAVEFIAEDDDRFQHWEPEDDGVWHLTGMVQDKSGYKTTYRLDKDGMKSTLLKAYAGVTRPREESTSTDGKGRPPPPAKPRAPGQPSKLRGIVGLTGERVNVKELINNQIVNISLAQLLDVSPATRQELSKMLQTPKVDKGKKPSKRARMSPGGANLVLLQEMAVRSAAANNVEKREKRGEHTDHDDAIAPLRPTAGDLFYTYGLMCAISKDDRIRITRCMRILIDGGSSANLVTRSAVEKLHARLSRLHSGTLEFANGSKESIADAVWLTVTVAGATRVVAAIIVDGSPAFELLLGRHWMYDTDVVGLYKDGTYSIMNDDGERQKMVRTEDYKPSSEDEMNQPPVHPTWVNSARKCEAPEVAIVSSDSDTDDDVDESDVDRELCDVLRDMSDDDYSADSESSGN
jgi:hypothetical protein